MAAKITMDPQEMTAKANQLDSKGNEFHQVVKEMETLVTQLCNAWEGSASAAFEVQFKGLKKSFKATEELIGDLAQQVRDISKIMTDADDTIAKKLKN